MKAYLENWNIDEEFYNDDPMEIDEIRRFKKKGFVKSKSEKEKHNVKRKQKEVDKYCHICDRYGHSTKECFYNLKTKNSNGSKKNYHKKEFRNKFIGEVNKTNFEESDDEGEDFTKLKIYTGNIDAIINEEEEEEIIKEVIEEETEEKEEEKEMLENVIEEEKENDDTKEKPEEHDRIKFDKEISEIIKETENKTEWLYDCGACEHITNNLTILKNFIREPNKLRCANGTYFTYEGYGEYEFKIKDRKYHLKRVLYSKEITKNIISAIELAKIGIKAFTTFENNKVKLLIMDENYNIIQEIISNKHNQFFLKVYSINFVKSINSIDKVENFKMIWHRRLGHYYNNNLLKYLMDHDIKVNDDCHDCKITKMKRISHNKETPKAKEILEVIHSDIIGPISKSITGKRFILTIIDEYSRKSWIFLLASKSEATDIIINFFNYLINQFVNKIKSLKSDNPKEYSNKKLLDYCKQKGIKKIFSPVYNPENNGLAERFNQTIISCAKTLLFWSQLSENFWDFAVNYANYLYNLIPHSSINNKIPNEVFFKTKSNIKHIKVFGCIAYYKNYNQNKTKFEPNSIKGIFLGVDEDSYSYIIMNYNNFKIYKYREIYCIENMPANISLSNEALNETQNDFFKYDFTNIKTKYYTNINNSIFTISNNNDYNQRNDNIDNLNKLFSNLRISDNGNNNIQGHNNDNTYKNNNIVDNNKINHIKSTNEYGKQLIHDHNKNYNNANHNISNNSKNFKVEKQIQLSDHKNTNTPDNFSNNNNTNNSINPNTNKVEFTPDKYFINNNNKNNN